MDAIQLLRAAYLGAAASVLVVFAIPATRSRFLDYGPRNAKRGTVEKEHGAQGKTVKADGGVLSDLLDTLAKVRVPHSWFTSFYAVSSILSLLWAAELLVKGPGFRAIAQYVPDGSRSMTFQQVMVVWVMMLAQGSRRLYECMVIAKPSSSEMWVGHWALGIFFYVATSVAVWVEGSLIALKHAPTARDFAIDPPSLRTFVGVMMFILASGLQHDCHAYLASLKDKKSSSGKDKSAYRLPKHPAWNISMTPHYFAECLIYLSLAITAAPQGDGMNWTLGSGLVFVTVNLGVTAYGTRKWYEHEFGVAAVNGKARMLPLIF
ncbi:hypothetical protein DOTSEDRAFT_141569 [Dothistroma septosporum NZE10]|uniref:Polyprenal reductase n=1 Tax=Dothistroma septosporum (strain NZE10 / CBS 128990) TaxID=675120 RepID=N1Q1H1_DOTSN|nr:hypothetical protein DOTSEDRAFT_141569 [Dothistroma septosporum NZE10]